MGRRVERACVGVPVCVGRQLGPGRCGKALRLPVIVFQMLSKFIYLISP